MSGRRASSRNCQGGDTFLTGAVGTRATIDGIPAAAFTSHLPLANLCRWHKYRPIILFFKFNHHMAPIEPSGRRALSTTKDDFQHTDVMKMFGSQQRDMTMEY
jgi:hypothetical protein